MIFTGIKQVPDLAVKMPSPSVSALANASLKREPRVAQPKDQGDCIE
jgi:hypothetical protein